MSLSIKALNNDTSFILSFAPVVSSSKQETGETITILLDPWIIGSAITINPAIAVLKRPSDAAIDSLQQLDMPPDLICISQDAPDHCHRATLMTLKSDTTCQIVAPASAAIKIKKWKYFKPHAIASLGNFSETNPSASGYAFNKRAMVRGTAKCVSKSGRSLSHDEACVSRPGTVMIHLIAEAWDLSAMHTLLAITYTSPVPAEAPVTVLYCPHGAVPATIKPYVATLLANTSIILLHACNQSKGPWFFGSPTYVYGATQGVEIAKTVAAKAWIRAHDEDKSPTGIATLGTWGIDIETTAVRRTLDETGLKSCELISLGAGEQWTFGGDLQKI